MVEDRAPRRYEAAQKVTGAARYEGEIRASGILHAALVTAPLPSARVLGIDTARARALAGCVDVLTHENAHKIPPAAFLALCQEPVVHFAGQPVALVLAESPETARAAAAMVDVRYAPTPAITALDQAREAAFAPRTAGLTATDSRRGEPEAALAAAAVSARAALHHADAQPPRHRAAGGAGPVGRQRPHRAHAVAGGVRPPHHAGEVFWPRRRARAGDLLLSRRRLRLERRRLGPLPGAGLPGGKAARPPGAAGASTRADVHPGRPPAGDGAAAAHRRRARRAPRRPPARHRGADLDLRRVRRSGRDAHAHDVRLPQRRHHAPPGAA